MAKSNYVKAIQNIAKRTATNYDAFITNMTDKELKKYWKSFRKKIGEQFDIKPPTYYQAINDDKLDQYFDGIVQGRDINMNTQPSNDDLDEQSADSVISQYEERIDKIYNDTLAYIAENKEGTGHKRGQLPSIADYRRSEIDDAYWTLKTQLQELKDSGIPAQIVAQAIADNVELDYSLAVSLLPPSDIKVEFEETVQQLFGVMQQIEARATELAEQAEREYYGLE